MNDESAGPKAAQLYALDDHRPEPQSIALPADPAGLSQFLRDLANFVDAAVR